MSAAFSKGDLVALRAAPERTGPVMDVLSAADGTIRYRVFHSADNVAEYYEDQLVAIEGNAPAPAETLASGAVLDADDFRSRLTAARLSHPLTDSLYSLHAARIKFIPFQFKPLLRFLRSDRQRLLIADEVGVGKTIEAGLILQEISGRQRLGNVLIVCPKALVEKWRSEMKRFDEDFHPLSSEQLRYCIRETQQDGVWPLQYSRAIVHIELLRREEHLLGTDGRRPRPGLLTLKPAPHFDMVIVDEAHHLRNPETNSHEVARYLCQQSEAALFLSATPVHTGSENLFSLLNLLRPDRFPTMEVFREIVEPNEHLNKAITLLKSPRRAEDWQEEALQALCEAAQTSWGSRQLPPDPRFNACVETLTTAGTPSDEERVNCARDLEEVHTLAHVMNRTRRKDIGEFTVREPKTIQVEFTNAQEQFYRALIEFRREVLLREYDPNVVRLITDTLERQASSCLPALIPMLQRFVHTGGFSAPEVSDAGDLDNAELPLGPEFSAKARELLALAEALPPDDPKLQRLEEIVTDTMEARGPGKVLLFSFFLHTLGYLAKKLHRRGLRVGLVSGQVPDEERIELRRRFRLPRDDEDAIDVLLSSEVGCEGLDYEFCDRLVNYDIPWNPMRVEQRIGRIDRFGQQSEKVLIYNFITPGTVEERIFFRCYERLGIFRRTVGELEAVLGELVQDLTDIANDPTLSPEQAEERARKLADNAIGLSEEQRRLEEEGGRLLSFDEGFTREVDELIEQRRYVAPDDLEHMIRQFVAQFGGDVSPVADEPKLRRVRINRDGRHAIEQLLNAGSRRSRRGKEFTQWLGGPDPDLVVTFDQETAVERRDLPFISPMHPLARLITEELVQDEQLLTRVAVRRTDLPAGLYLFIFDLWETVGLQERVELMGHAWNLETDEACPEIGERLTTLLADGKPTDGELSLSEEIIGRVLAQLEDSSRRSLVERRARIQEKNEELVDLRRSSQDAYYEARKKQIEEQIGAATDERIGRMKTSELQRVEAEHRATIDELEKQRDADIVTRRIAAGLLQVQLGGSGHAE